jgi:hypothetical protein
VCRAARAHATAHTRVHPLALALLLLLPLIAARHAGLRLLHELWPGLDAAALAASDPKHLALALRALSAKGPPHRM